MTTATSQPRYLTMCFFSVSTGGRMRPAAWHSSMAFSTTSGTIDLKWLTRLMSFGCIFALATFLSNCMYSPRSRNSGSSWKGLSRRAK